MNIESEYTAISVNTLTTGTKIDYSIYYEHQKEFVLLCKNVVLTQDLIDKFRKVTYPDFKIYIPNDRYDAMVFEKTTIDPHGPDRKKAKFLVDYSEIKSNTAEMFSEFRQTNRVSEEITNSIAETVQQQIETVDVSVIVQGINSIRKVDEYLHTHCANVALLNGLMGRWLHLGVHELDELIKVGLLHDVGKLKIPVEIINKPDRLTAAEFNIVKQHSVLSYTILLDSGVTSKRILDGVLQHHEKVNGLGYPHGLCIADITEFARITSISDVYDAMITKRVYKDSHSPFEILAWFAKGCYSDLDIHFVDVFLDCMLEELKGKTVRLSDGTEAEVLFIPIKDIMYPIVSRNGEVIQTTPALCCTELVL